MAIQLLSIILLLTGIGLAFSNIRLTGWVLGWILLSGALLVQGFRSILSHLEKLGSVDSGLYAVANDWMGLGFSLLIVASMYLMREVFARHRLAIESLRMVSAVANDAIIVMDNTATVVVWNGGAQRIFGYDKQEAQGNRLQELIVPERQRNEFEKMFIQFGGSDRESFSATPTELAGLRKDGTEIYTEYSMSKANIDGKWHAIYIVRDITARKSALEESFERTTMLEMLSAKMLNSEEMEKKKLAFGLHEDLAQTLITIKLRIEHKLQQLAANNAGDESLASIVPLLQSTIANVQTIAIGLRPSSLDELGLLPTINWYCRVFGRLNPTIRVEHEFSVLEEDIPAALKIVIFRIVESAFTSIARNNISDQIQLGLQLEAGAITLIIDDSMQDTQYAAVGNCTSKTELQMRLGEAQERTILSGGSFTIASNKAGGVTLRASWAT